MRGGLVLVLGITLWLATVAAKPPAGDRDARQPNAVNLSADEGPVGTNLMVSGTGFDPGSRVQVFIDSAEHPLGPSALVGREGTFQQEVTIPDGATEGRHQICAQLNSRTPTCSGFGVVAAPPTPTSAPTPTATPTPTPSPSPTSSPTSTPVPIGAVPNSSGGALSPLFPWILVPAAILLGLLVLAIYLIRRGRGGGPSVPGGPPRGPARPRVTHRSPRPYRGPTWSEPGSSKPPPGQSPTLPGGSDEQPGLPPGDDDRPLRR